VCWPAYCLHSQLGSCRASCLQEDAPAACCRCPAAVLHHAVVHCWCCLAVAGLWPQCCDVLAAWSVVLCGDGATCLGWGLAVLTRLWHKKSGRRRWLQDCTRVGLFSRFVCKIHCAAAEPAASVPVCCRLVRQGVCVHHFLLLSEWPGCRTDGATAVLVK
jgi:hypothetical protein